MDRLRKDRREKAVQQKRKRMLEDLEGGEEERMVSTVMKGIPL